MGMLKSLWAYRGFILGSVKREFQLKYRNSLLGAAWTVLNPLAMIVVYTVIFSEVMRARLPGVGGTYAYSIYLCAGILTWGLFAEIVGRCQTMFIENANLLKKISFPRMCLPVIIVFISASIGLFSRLVISWLISIASDSDHLLDWPRRHYWSFECFFQGCGSIYGNCFAILVLVNPHRIFHQHIT